MDIVCAFDEKFVVPSSVMISSGLSAATEKLNFHFLVPPGFIESHSKQTILDLFTDYPFHKCDFYEVDLKTLFKSEISMNGLAHFSDAALFRVVMEKVLPTNLDNIIYLDGDLFIRKWDELTRILALKPIFSARAESARSSLGKDKYFNSGVFITSLSYWRQEEVSNQMIQFLISNPSSLYKDQDALNFVFGGINLKMSTRVNCPAKNFEGVKDVEVIHYVGSIKPWKIHAPLTQPTRMWRGQYRGEYGFKPKLEKVNNWLLKFIFTSAEAFVLSIKVISKRQPSQKD